MILSRPMPGILNRENKNQGPNPYAAQAAGLLQQIQAQNAMQARIYEEAAAKNQAEANKGALSMGQFAEGMKKLMNKSNPTPTIQDDNSQPFVRLNDQYNPMMSDQGEVPVPQQTRVGINTVGNMTPAKAPQSFSEMLPKLAAAAKTAYPDNPTMQQVALTQAVLESRLLGKPSTLASDYNNYFGIKANRSYPGTNGNVDVATTEYIGGSPATVMQGFARNNSMADSFAQHASLMSGASRYSPVLQATNPNDAFGALQKAGYATDPNYAAKLRAIHQRYISPYYNG